MSIENFYTTEFTVKRQTFSGGKSSLVTQGTFKGHLQQAGPDIMQQYQGLRHSKAWTIWCKPSTDVQEGDRLTAGGVNYDVRFVENRNVGNEGHLQLVAEEPEN